MSSLFSSFSTISYFFFNHPAPTEIYTLSLHDALPILRADVRVERPREREAVAVGDARNPVGELARVRSEEHTSELQSQFHLVCRLLLEKKKKQRKINDSDILK